MMMTEDYPKKGNSGTTSGVLYSVEARYNYHEPCEIAGQLFDNRWKRVRFDKSIIGIPSRKPMNVTTDLVVYSAAEAQRWWLHAIADYEYRVCLETKIVAHNITSSYEITAVSEHGIIDSRNRKSVKPD